MNDATRLFIQANANADVRALALQAKKYPLVDISFALCQIAGRQRIRAKLPTFYANADWIFPDTLPLEQCSSEATARYKARLISGHSLVDLTGGFGVDCYFAAQNFAQTDYVEQQIELCQIAEQNFASTQQNIRVHNTNSVEFLQQMMPVDCILIDPARRDDCGRKVAGLTDCTPDLTQIAALLTQKAKCVLAKLSPMLDLKQALEQLPATQAVHVLAVDGECKEMLLVLQTGTKPQGQISITATNISRQGEQSFTFCMVEECAAQPVFADHIESYLFEPNAAILKAGAFRCIAERYGLQKLHPNTHLYTSSQPCPEFCGRQFEVIAIHSLQKTELKSLAKLGKANIAVRNFPDTAEQLRRKLKLTDGGDTYLFGLTLHDGKHVVAECKKNITINIQP